MPLNLPDSSELDLGLPLARFMQDHWQKKPLLARAAAPSAIHMMSAEELAGIACDTDLASRIITGSVDTGNWTVQHGPFSEDDFTSLPDSDCTLLVQDLDKLLPCCRDLQSLFSFLPSWRHDDVMVSYAAPGGSVGPHVDEYDVFLIQVSGNRRWYVDTEHQSGTELIPGLELGILQNFDSSEEVLMQPGDLLYLPPGCAHYGIAETSCLTASIGFRAPSDNELLLGFSDDLALKRGTPHRLADPDRQLTRTPGLIDALTLQRVARSIRKLADQPDQDIADWFARFITEFRLIDSRFYQDEIAGFDELVASGTALVRNPSARLAYIPFEGGCRLYVNGDVHETSAELAALVADNVRLEPDQIRHIIAIDRTDLLRRLYENHVFMEASAFQD